MRERWWVALVVAGTFVVAIVMAYNTGYGAGHADGVVQLSCIEQAQATASNPQCP